MQTKDHAEQFKRIIQEYKLEEKAEEIASYLTKNQHIDAKEFSKLFNIPLEKTQIFLSFIEKGLNYRKKNTLQ